MKPHPFEFEPLWHKAKVFMERGLAARRESKDDEWPLWASLAAELLGKAVLAKRHPVLVAHPGTGREDDAANSLLSAAGIEVREGGLRSIEMHTVIVRLSKVLPPEFDQRVQKALKVAALMRNEELHSGAVPFAGLEEHTWAPGFWQAISLLLKDIGKSVQDFVGPKFETLVVGLIAATEASIEKAVKEAMGAAKERWKVRSDDNGGEEAYRKKVTGKVHNAHSKEYQADCPVCGCCGTLTHSDVELSSVRRVGDDSQILTDKRYRADDFECEGCSLYLDGTAALAKAGLPVDVRVTLDEEALFEMEYGND